MLTHPLVLFQNPHSIPGREGKQTMPSDFLCKGHGEVGLGPQRFGARSGVGTLMHCCPVKPLGANIFVGPDEKVQKNF